MQELEYMDYLASGFKDVDRAQDASKYSDCLNFFKSIEFFRTYKQQTFELLALDYGFTVLDVGCGLGEDVLTIARLVGPLGKVIGIDASDLLLKQARAKLSNVNANVEFLSGDALALPFDDGTFERCRIDRTLQHCSAPLRALSEMARVLKDGGLMLAFDNDWETFTFSSQNREVTRKVAHLWCDSFPAGWVGRYLYGYFKECGLVEVEVHPQTLVITKLEVADKVFDLFQSIERAKKAEIISNSEGNELVEELCILDKKGLFFCSYTGFIVVGQKPNDSSAKWLEIFNSKPA